MLRALFVSLGLTVTALAGPLVSTAHAAVPAGEPAAGSVLAAVVPSDPSIDCDTGRDRTGSCAALRPELSCVWDNHDGTYTAVLDYDNPSRYRLHLTAGGDGNAMLGLGIGRDAGQPSDFEPGNHHSFTVTWTQQGLLSLNVWSLADHFVWFGNWSTACASHPVPVIGSVAAAGASLLLVMGVFLVANARAVRAQRTADHGPNGVQPAPIRRFIRRRSRRQRQ